MHFGLNNILLLLVFVQQQAVGDVEEIVDAQKADQIQPHELVDAASPPVNKPFDEQNTYTY